MFGMIGGPELLAILILATLLFGADKIPKLARASGEAVEEFKQAQRGSTDADNES